MSKIMCRFGHIRVEAGACETRSNEFIVRFRGTSWNMQAYFVLRKE